MAAGLSYYTSTGSSSVSLSIFTVDSNKLTFFFKEFTKQGRLPLKPFWREKQKFARKYEFVLFSLITDYGLLKGKFNFER